jgi:hypothetical protein
MTTRVGQPSFSSFQLGFSDGGCSVKPSSDILALRDGGETETKKCRLVDTVTMNDKICYLAYS